MRLKSRDLDRDPRTDSDGEGCKKSEINIQTADRKKRQRGSETSHTDDDNGRHVDFGELLAVHKNSKKRDQPVRFWERPIRYMRLELVP